MTNGLTQSLPKKVFFAGPMFRYERPQKGRYRQFHQIDIELIGPSEPLADAEVIACGWDILKALGVHTDTVLELNTSGRPASRAAYREALVALFHREQGALSKDSLVRLERNPMRILDSKDAAGARPDRRRAEDLAVSVARGRGVLRQGAGASGPVRRAVPGEPRHRPRPGLLRPHRLRVRDLQTGRAGHRDGGRTLRRPGRRDGRSRDARGRLGGRDGAAGACCSMPRRRAPAPVAVVPIGDEAEAAAIGILQSLRAAGIRAEMAYRGNLRRRMERANRIDARAAVILGADDLAQGVAQVKDLRTGDAGGGEAAGHRRPSDMNLALKLDRIAARADELRAMLSEGVSGEAYVKASKELSEIEPVVARIGELREAERARQDASTLLDDPEMRELAEAELFELKDKIPALEHEIQLALLPKDEADARSAILEIRPAAGGDEAGLFAAELFAMYQKYSEGHGWRFEILEYGDTGLGGLKDATAEITGRNVFARLKVRVRRAPRAARAGDRESGAHPHLHRHRRRAAGGGGGRCADR